MSERQAALTEQLKALGYECRPSGSGIWIRFYGVATLKVAEQTIARDRAA